MSNLVVFGFDGVHTADEVFNKFYSMRGTGHADLDDACIVERDASGQIHIKQAVNPVAAWAKSGGKRGAFWGGLVGILFLNPLAGLAVGALAGAGVGAFSGSLSGYGILDDFIKQLGQVLLPASSALCLRLERNNVAELMSQFEPYRPRVLTTMLSNEEEDRLAYELKAAWVW